MARRESSAFLALVLVQACHSIEEYRFRLWEALPPARFVSGLFGLDPAAGFALVNSALVGFGLWCFLVPVRRSWPSGPALMWGWGLIEVVNGTAHLGLAVAAGGYFPGLYTAPLLTAAGAWLLYGLAARAG
jgi:hypothetical protein